MFRKLMFFVLSALVGAVVVVVVLASRYPDQFVMARKIEIDAPPGAVFAQINDFHNWQELSPWAKIDPQVKATIEGPASGEGAVFGGTAMRRWGKER